MANLRDIRNRIESIGNTQQITRAMKMVAAAKLRKAQDRIIETRPYASKMKEVVGRMVKSSSDENVLLDVPETTDNVLFVIVGSDRGLCGGFNNNLFKVLGKEIDENYSEYKENDNLSLICIGRQATKHFGKRDYNIKAEFPGFWDDIEFPKATEIMKSVINEFKSGNFDEVKLVYNEFKSVIAQNRLIENLQLWRAILESNAAEQGARMTAMDNATENAQEMKEDLQLEYNRARQSAITTEISEIISGAQALEEA